MNSELTFHRRDDGSIDYDAFWKRAHQARSAYVHEVLGKGASAVTPSGRSVRTFALACCLAAGAFGLTMLKDPPQSVASDPSDIVTKSTDVQVPETLPALDCLKTGAVCP